MAFQALTIEQLRDRIGERRVLDIADRDHDNVLNDEETRSLNLNITRATSFAYSLIGVEVATPIGEIDSEQLLGVVADFTEWYCQGRGDVASEHLRTRYDDAKAWCKAVGKRMAMLGTETGKSPSSRREIAVHNGDPREFFNDPVGDVL